MTLEPLFNATPAIQIHVATVIPAAILGAWVLFGRKGTALHKALGRVWVALMFVTALSSFFVHELRLIGVFSPIHVLSIVTLVSCGVIVWSARARRFEIHQRTVKGLYWGGIGLAGVFTLLPGRIMNAVVLGGAGQGLGLPSAWVVGLIGAIMLAAWVRWRANTQHGRDSGA